MTGDAPSIAPETGRRAQSPISTGGRAAEPLPAPLWPKCAECLASLPANNQRRQMFCCEEHRRAFQRRIAKRGFRLAVPAQASYQTRHGTRGDRATGSWAATSSSRMMQDWRDEDRAAGRMSMVDYYRRRLALGMAD